MLKKALLLLLALLLCCASAFSEEITGYNKKQDRYCYVTFGTYPEDSAGNEAPILWRVLSVEEDEAYLLTEYIIDVHYVHYDSEDYYDLEWQDSDLYEYLQTRFMEKAFTDAEQAALLRCAEDDALVTLPSVEDIRNKDYGFDDNRSRVCKVTGYAKFSDVQTYSGNTGTWLTRDKSINRKMQQRRVMDEGVMGTAPCNNDRLGLRPCIYVDLTQLMIQGGDGSMDDPFVLSSTAEPVEKPDVLPTAVPVAVPANDAQDVQEDVPQIVVPQVVSTPKPAEEKLPSSGMDLSALIGQYMKDKGKTTVAPMTVVDSTEVDPENEEPLPDEPEDEEPLPEEPEDEDLPITITFDEPENEPDEVMDLVQDENVDNAPVFVISDPADSLPMEDDFTAAQDDLYIHASFDGMLENGFLPEGEAEYVLADEENGLWLYASQSLRIQIERKSGTNSKKQPLRWYEARIFTLNAEEMFDLYPLDESEYTNYKVLSLADEIARKHQLVFAINSDNFIYRESRQHDKDVNYTYPKGLIIRDGQVFYDVPRKSTSTVYPPLDVLALYPNGDMRAYVNGTMTADQLLQTGATDTLSYGPLLVEDGEISPRASEFGSTPNPRTAIGMVEPGHYVCVMVESRIAESKGESCLWLADIMQEMGCHLALNLDSGAASSMHFMGRQINETGNYGDTTSRQLNELIGIGYSENAGK